MAIRIAHSEIRDDEPDTWRLEAIFLTSGSVDDGTFKTEALRMSCCTYRDHSPGPCACADHPVSELHPYGS